MSKYAAMRTYNPDENFFGDDLTEMVNEIEESSGEPFSEDDWDFYELIPISIEKKLEVVVKPQRK